MGGFIYEQGGISMKTLVVYYSRKGSVRKLALERAEELGADFLELETVTDVTGPSGFMRCGASAVTGKSMPIFPYDTDVSSYDKVIIFSPVWAGKVSTPVMEFVRKERRNIYEADYVFVSGSGKPDAETLAVGLDKILRLDHGSAENIKNPFIKTAKKEDASDGQDQD